MTSSVMTQKDAIKFFADLPWRVTTDVIPLPSSQRKRRLYSWFRLP